MFHPILAHKQAGAQVLSLGVHTPAFLIWHRSHAQGDGKGWKGKDVGEETGTKKNKDSGSHNPPYPSERRAGRSSLPYHLPTSACSFCCSLFSASLDTSAVR
eukprot:TRINITY_DN21402_c0_g1_i1.p2 TRINITY_DN21402_c0_g1~~TRINITY_DN21402_c0_g1_i1.p2  ORF type:complete len:102 (-),score=8.43 TRINITY_DN21402_c0_g1_i1:118-423(-)